jgi:hypothetical protein
MRGPFQFVLPCVAVLAAAGPVSAQTKVIELEKRPVFRVDVVEKITVAVNYRHRSGATLIDFRGTILMPRASGRARVASQRGYIEIEAEFKNMGSPMTFGAEYLTFVLWAITPEGRASNLGEVVVRDGKSKLSGWWSPPSPTSPCAIRAIWSCSKTKSARIRKALSKSSTPNTNCSSAASTSRWPIR